MLGRFDKLQRVGEGEKTLSRIYRENNINPDQTAIVLAMDGGMRLGIPRAYDNVSVDKAAKAVATQEAAKIGRTTAYRTSATTTFIHHYELHARNTVPNLKNESINLSTYKDTQPSNYEIVRSKYHDDIENKFNENKSINKFVGTPLKYMGESMCEPLFSYTVGFKWFIFLTSNLNIPNIKVKLPIFFYDHQDDRWVVNDTFRFRRAHLPDFSKFARGDVTYTINPVNFLAVASHYVASHIGKVIGYLITLPFTLPAYLIFKAWYKAKEKYIGYLPSLARLDSDELANGWIENGGEGLPADDVAKYVSVLQLAKAKQAVSKHLVINADELRKYAEKRQEVLESFKPWKFLVWSKKYRQLSEKIETEQSLLRQVTEHGNLDMVAIANGQRDVAGGTSTSLVVSFRNGDSNVLVPQVYQQSDDDSKAMDDSDILSKRRKSSSDHHLTEETPLLSQSSKQQGDSGFQVRSEQKSKAKAVQGVARKSITATPQETETAQREVTDILRRISHNKEKIKQQKQDVTAKLERKQEEVENREFVLELEEEVLEFIRSNMGKGEGEERAQRILEEKEITERQKRIITELEDIKASIEATEGGILKLEQEVLKRNKEKQEGSQIRALEQKNMTVRPKVIPFGKSAPTHEESVLLAKLGFDISKMTTRKSYRGTYHYLEIPSTPEFHLEVTHHTFDQRTTDILYNGIKIISIWKKSAFYDSEPFVGFDKNAAERALLIGRRKDDPVIAGADGSPRRITVD